MFALTNIYYQIFTFLLLIISSINKSTVLDYNEYYVLNRLTRQMNYIGDGLLKEKDVYIKQGEDWLQKWITYDYDPFGKTLESDDDGDPPSNPFHFTGQFYDPEIAQYHLRARQYDPVI